MLVSVSDLYSWVHPHKLQMHFYFQGVSASVTRIMQKISKARIPSEFVAKFGIV
jgi:hypothetical protein